MDMQRGEAVTTEAEWTAQYGRVLKLKNPLGVSGASVYGAIIIED